MDFSDISIGDKVKFHWDEIDNVIGDYLPVKIKQGKVTAKFFTIIGDERVGMLAVKVRTTICHITPDDVVKIIR